MQDSTFIGLDIHKATISVAVAQGRRRGEVRHWGTIPNRPDHLRKLVEKLSAHGSHLHFCYEADPCGYVVCAANWPAWGMTASLSRRHSFQ